MVGKSEYIFNLNKKKSSIRVKAKIISVGVLMRYMTWTIKSIILGHSLGDVGIGL